MPLQEGLKLELWSGAHRISVDHRKVSIFTPPSGKVTLRKEYGMVVLFFEDKRLEMSTPVAVKVGLALVKHGGGVLEANDVVVLNISGVEVLMLPETAARIGGALIRKADKADDWQRDNLTPHRRFA